ncbi:hypothetical protein [Paraurantiacibacter namhicola]|uniref:Uncharacterized protein n=1 Tax=Paraurantiacibacter namhicola TaxID=645517 RepID=A0A1C7DAQ2_9SPHN|nr:hypothetical protein [Paraurantiacibacter namhicola]ANU08497.1 hypothetical protein A6F65_02212 [Paraurantiacibacter namhicola]
MKTLKAVFAPALALAMAAGIATPAQAQYYGGGNYYEAGYASPRAIERELRQIERQVDRAAYDRRVSDRTLTWMQYRVAGVRKQFRRAARGGFNDWELRTMENQVYELRRDIDHKLRYGHNSRGYRYEQHNRHGRYEDRRGYGGNRGYYRGRDRDDDDDD